MCTFIQFTDIQVNGWLLENIQLAKYDRPTPVQKYGLPIVLSGRDLMACAQTGTAVAVTLRARTTSSSPLHFPNCALNSNRTGSGKTAAFLFPILSKLLDNGQPVPRDDGRGRRRKAYPEALVLAPTRELASQIHDEAKKVRGPEHAVGTAVVGLSLKK